MKYIEFPNAAVIIYANQSNTYEIYKNNSNSFILVMGYPFSAINMGQEQTEPYWDWYAITVNDPENNVIDFIAYEEIFITLQNAQIPVWNGTSSVLETGQIPVSVRNQIDHVGKSMIPPLGSISIIGSGSAQFNVIVSGGWGLVLNEEEILQVIKR